MRAMGCRPFQPMKAHPVAPFCFLAFSVRPITIAPMPVAFAAGTVFRRTKFHDMVCFELSKKDMAGEDPVDYLISFSTLDLTDPHLPNDFRFVAGSTG
jgi:hypothetical protein